MEKWYDVIVCGAGVAGISAAISAARTGAKTLLVEESGTIGGTASMGLNCSFEGVDMQLMGGLFAEIIEQLQTRNAIIVGIYAPFSISDFQDVCYEMIAQEGVEVIYHVQQTRALVKDGRVAGLELVSREGDQIRLFGTCVDATGDAAISAGAGVPFEIGSPNSGEIQPVTLLFRMGNVDIEKLLEYIHKKDQFYKEPMLFEMDDTRRPPLLIGNGFFDWVRQEKEKGLDVGREAISIIKTPNPGEVLINSTRVRQVNALNPFEEGKAIAALYKQKNMLVHCLRKDMPGFENSYVIDNAPILGVRETRRIRGKYQLTISDILKGQDFSDRIARNFFPVDIHGPNDNPEGYKWELPGGNGTYAIPIGCLIPKHLTGLYVAGRCISVSHEAHGSTRTMPCCMATGQAAGICAAFAAQGKDAYPSFVKLVQMELRRQNVRI